MSISPEPYQAIINRLEAIEAKLEALESAQISDQSEALDEADEAQLKAVKRQEEQLEAERDNGLINTSKPLYPSADETTKLMVPWPVVEHLIQASEDVAALYVGLPGDRLTRAVRLTREAVAKPPPLVKDFKANRARMIEHLCKRHHLHTNDATQIVDCVVDWIGKDPEE